MTALGQNVGINPGFTSGGERDNLWITADSTPGFSSDGNAYNDSSLINSSCTIILFESGPLQPGVDITIDANGFHWLTNHIIVPGERYCIEFAPQPEIVNTPSVLSTYANVINGLVDPTNNVDKQWSWLLNGLEYVGLDGRKHKWQGFIAVADDTSPKKSLLANGIYYYWMQNSATFTAGSGEKITKSDAAYSVNNVGKAVNAWNEMSDWLHEMIWFLDTFTSGTNGMLYGGDYLPDWWLQNRYYLLKKYKKINQLNI
jgi:hypothetical protein